MARTSSQQEVWKAYEKEESQTGQRKHLANSSGKKWTNISLMPMVNLLPKQWGTVADKLGL